MMTDTYLQALLGGMLLGLGASLLMLANGKIAGISGITHQALRSLTSSPSGWRWCFLVGLIVAPLLVAPFGLTLPDAIPGSMWVLAAGGLLVGIGTRVGSGCTSGHGICGIGRLSKRSIVATLTFMATAIATVTVTRHLL
ncbi:YeeE/YedE thiosulfate transporter family protein [Alteromonas sp. ASW11-19]|uniref:YeeE/YedE thiosulfate transporter family protein n=2 Tax=Alteromonas salexigens TaxID=2982530 RepID=A0ABT2VJ34_9ALTE|nr:YeeE/YedE thiosulfate transporter family protein [Alteromonas salexigens]MCU7553205.1 YeeE/YedE thiosulfate transporter family protein [Alteromonas salexigens]